MAPPVAEMGRAEEAGETSNARGSEAVRRLSRMGKAPLDPYQRNNVPLESYI